MAAILALGACATLAPPLPDRASSDAGVQECSDWYRDLDATIDSAGVRDAQARPVKGFPYLRVDRFHAALGKDARSASPALQPLIERLMTLDRDSRALEIANLPPGVLRGIWKGLGNPDPATAVEFTRTCAVLMRDFDLDSGEASRTLRDNLVVPDDYVPAYRIAGLYALARIPFSLGVSRQEDSARIDFGRALGPVAHGSVVRYSPAPHPRPDAGRVRQILAQATDNALRIPLPSDDDLEALFSVFAPSFEVVTTGDHDRPGALRWRWGAVPEVDATDIAVYRDVAHTRYRGQNLLQLVYTLWFAERPPSSATDLLSGKLDGVVFRVTLAPDGTPIAYDTMHPCGCYHMFFTTARALPLAAPPGEPEWAFVPQDLGEARVGDRLVLRVASRTHYVERVFRDPVDSLVRYELRPYAELRSLRTMRGGAQSVFGPDGIISGTERGERFLFWPMGIANAGAMRQWGRHATAFVGRRHFDDADLFERRFELDLR